MHAAAEAGNRHLAFMSLISANAMFSEIAEEADIDRYDTLKEYNPQDLRRTAQAYDAILNAYGEEYARAGIQAKHYPDIDAFVRDYERNPQSGDRSA